MPARSPTSLDALGIVCALGSGTDNVWPRLIAGDPSGLRVRRDLVAGKELLLGGVVDVLPPVPEPLARFACRNNALALAALQQIESPVRALIDRVGPARVGVVVGTSTSGVSDAEHAILYRQQTGRLAPSFDYAQLEFGGIAGFLAAYLGVGGPAYTLSTACSSGARALATARSLVRLGVCDGVISGAADSLCRLTTHGFSALAALSETRTNPCSLNRKGLTLGEAAALFLVTADPGKIELVGVGESSEAHHMSAPDPGGRGAERSMRAALTDAELEPAAIAYLNLHGTGTPLNDAMECDAIARVFGTDLPCSSTKPLVGHTLGAAGALEAAFCWMMLEHSPSGSLPLPPHLWDGVRDPEIADVRLVSKGELAQASAPARVMTNSFAFGGNNCTLVLERRVC